VWRQEKGIQEKHMARLKSGEKIEAKVMIIGGENG